MKSILSIIFVQSVQLLSAQTITPNIVTDKYIGKVIFIARNIDTEKLKESDLVYNCTLTDTTQLFFRLFLKNSLVTLAHEIDNNAFTTEELLRFASFKVNFFVDNKNIYSEQMYPMSIKPNEKQEKTVFTWSIQRPEEGYFWMKFMLNGGDEALSNGSHIVKIQIQPCLIVNNTVKTGGVIAQGQIKLKIIRPIVNERAAVVQKIKEGSGFNISTERFDTARIRELNKKILQERFKSITSIVVIKNSKLLIEEYFNGDGRDTLHDTRSVGKTFASALFGIAVAEGHITDINMPLSSFYDLKNFSNYSTYKDSITLRQLLTMTSSFKGNDDDENSPGNENNMYDKDNYVKWTLDLPVDSSRVRSPSWAYFTAGVMLLGDVLNKSVPKGLDIYADVKIFRPLGVSNYRWEYTPQKVPFTGGGIKLRSVDLAKFGYLYKNHGVWNEQQIVPKNWIKESMQPYYSAGQGANYGYLWWNKTYEVKGKKYEAFFCSGNGGNKIIVFKDIPVVIVITAEAFNTSYHHIQADRMVDKYILPSIVGH